MKFFKLICECRAGRAPLWFTVCVLGVMFAICFSVVVISL